MLLAILLILHLRQHVHDASHLQVLLLGELSENGLQLGLLNQRSQLKVVLGTTLQIRADIPRVLD